MMQTQTQAKSSTHSKRFRRELIWILVLVLELQCLCLRQGRCHSEKKIIVFALVLESLVTTRLQAPYYYYDDNDSRTQSFNLLSRKIVSVVSHLMPWACLIFMDNSEKRECKQALLTSFSAATVLHSKTFITELSGMINF